VVQNGTVCVFYGVKEDLVHPPAAHIKNKEDRYNLPKGVV